MKKRTKSFFSNKTPDEYIKYGKYEVRIRNKVLIEAGCVVKSKVKCWGSGQYGYPYRWKENKSDAEYKESWDDPRLPNREEKPKEN